MTPMLEPVVGLSLRLRHSPAVMAHDRGQRPSRDEAAAPDAPPPALADTVAAINSIYDWTSPLDPDNPRNGSLARRTGTSLAVTVLAFSATVAGAIYAPAQHLVAGDFHCSAEVAILPLALYNLGLAFGPLVGAPLSETYGRKAVFVVSTPVFLLFIVGASLSRSITSLTVCRFFAGVFASPLINNASAVILDCTDSCYRGVNLGAYYTIPSFGAVFGPLMGGLIVQQCSWRWTQWTALILVGALFVPVVFVRETYKKVILQRRAVRLGLQDSESQRTSPAKAFRYFATTLIQRPVHMLLTEPIVTLVSLYNGFIFGLMYTFVVVVPWVFEHYYGFHATGQALAFLGLNCGALLACVPLIVLDLRFYQRRLSRWSRSHGQDEPLPPENRLLPGMMGSFVLPVSLFVVGWTIHFRLHWMVPIVFMGLAMFSSLLVYASANLFMLDSYGPLYGASASGAMMLARYTLSTVFPLFAKQMYLALGVGWATSLLAFVTLAMAPIHWVFWTCGEGLRRRSRYERSI